MSYLLYTYSKKIAGNAVELTFDNIDNVPVTSAASLSDWNNFFQLPGHGNPFTSVSVMGNTIYLRGGSDIAIKMSAFQDNHNLISLNDQDGCIIEVGEMAFFGCDHALSFVMNGLITLTGVGSFGYCSFSQTFDFPLLQNTGTVSFQNCTIPYLSFPSLQNIGLSCFQDCVNTIGFDFPSVTDVAYYGFLRCTAMEVVNLPSCLTLGLPLEYDLVFSGITGKSITLTIPSALMTCAGGLPDWDIRDLQNNNTVTIIQV